MIIRLGSLGGGADGTAVPPPRLESGSFLRHTKRETCQGAVQEIREVTEIAIGNQFRFRCRLVDHFSIGSVTGHRPYPSIRRPSG